MNNPFTDGKKIKLGYDYFAKGFTDGQINEAYYLLIANPEQERLLLETATIDEINEIYNPGEDYYEENDRLTTDVIMEAIRVQRFARTDKKMAAFVRVLNTQMQDKGIEAQAPIIGTPKKSGLFATVTIQIPFSDGQILSIIFHSPDNNKMKIMADDEIIAFRWLLNKRDITHVVSIEGEGEVSLQEIGKRMSQLIEKNSARFQSTQKHLIEQKKQLEDSRAQAEGLAKKHDELMARLKEYGDDAELLDTQIAKLKEQIGKQKNFNDDLQAKIDALKAKQAGNDGKPVGGTTPKTEEEMKAEQEATAFAEKKAAFGRELTARGFEVRHDGGIGVFGLGTENRIDAAIISDHAGYLVAVGGKEFACKTIAGLDKQIEKSLAWIDKKVAGMKKNDEGNNSIITEIKELPAGWSKQQVFDNVLNYGNGQYSVSVRNTGIEGREEFSVALWEGPQVINADKVNTIDEANSLAVDKMKNVEALMEAYRAAVREENNFPDPEGLGQQAFKDGEDRVPPIGMLTDEKIAWLKGWDKANVAYVPPPQEPTADPDKEPWQMTKDEWFDLGKEYVTDEANGKTVSYFPREGATERKPATDHGHIYHIKKALSEGKNVTAEVLKDYPDLAVKSNVPTDPAAVTVLNDILSGKYDGDTTKMGIALDNAAADLEKDGKAAEYDELLNRAADYLTAALRKEAA